MSPVRADLDADVVISRQIGPMLEDNDDTNAGTAIDLTAYPGYKVMAICSTGARTDGTFTFSLLGSSDDGAADAYAAITPISGSMAAISAANTTREASFVPTERYIKLSCVASATTSGADIAGYLVLVPQA